ncbi:MAG: DUF1428 domain-containing protein [Kofleriaceae bacterium]
MSNYIDGFIIPVKTSRKQEYIEGAAKMSKRYLEWGATSVIECWGDDVPNGKVTDFKRAVAAEPDETVVFSYVVWPSKEARDAGQKKMHDDPEMAKEMASGKDMPFNMQRMIFGGFAAVVETGARK